MTTIQDLCDYLGTVAPLQLAEDWDNVGLLIGTSDRPLERVMTCLTVTPETVREAISRDAGLIVTHHPFPFRPLKKITSDDSVGAMLIALIENQISVFSAHTAFDSAKEGINQQLAVLLGLNAIQPLCDPSEIDATVGTGRAGTLPTVQSLDTIAERLAASLRIETLRAVGPSEAPVSRIGIACGSAGQFLAQARTDRCDLLITGETSFHTCLEAEATEVHLLLLGHYASERFAMEWLARRIASDYPSLDVWASNDEVDPLRLFRHPLDAST